MSAKPKLRAGLIGTGFMGKTHVFGFATALKVFGLPFDIELRTVADVTEAAAQRAAAEFGFARATSDWREIILDPEIEIVDITAPNALHEEMALTAIGAGKHVYCEKPVATRSAGARRMAAAAETAGIRTQVGFNYLCNPMFACAREMIQSGELGEIRGYRGLHCEDYMADAASPFTFRHDPEGGGALADLGSHALASAEFLLGPISKVMGDCVIAILERPVTTGGTRPVTVDDTTRVFLRFENGATGSIEANWVATGRKMQHDFEIWVRAARFPSARSGCTGIRSMTGPGGKVFAVSRPDRTTRRTASSALPRPISWASTISRPSRWRDSFARSRVKLRSRSASGRVCEFRRSSKRLRARRLKGDGWR